MNDTAHWQMRCVTVYRLIMRDTIGERIVEMQESKRQLVEDILSSEGLRSGELMALLGCDLPSLRQMPQTGTSLKSNRGKKCEK